MCQSNCIWNLSRTSMCSRHVRCRQAGSTYYSRIDHLGTGSKLPSQSVLSRSSKENVVIGRRGASESVGRLAKLQFLFSIVRRNYI